MSDRIQIQCPGCSAKLAISDESKLGKKIRCSKCSEVFVAKALKASGSATTKPKSKSKKSDDDEFNFDEMEDKSEIEDEESEAESRPLKAKNSKAKIGAKGKGKRKSGGNMPLIIGGSVAVVLLLGVGSYFLFRGQQEPAPGQQEPAPVAAPVAQQPAVPAPVVPADATNDKIPAKTDSQSTAGPGPREQVLARLEELASQRRERKPNDIPWFPRQGVSAKGYWIDESGKLSLIDLAYAPVKDADLEMLKSVPDVEHINLMCTTISDAGLEHLSQLKSLKSLTIWLTPISEDAARKFQETHPSCKLQGPAVTK